MVTEVRGDKTWKQRKEMSLQGIAMTTGIIKNTDVDLMMDCVLIALGGQRNCTGWARRG
jgi:hypothetical protein